MQQHLDGDQDRFRRAECLVEGGRRRRAIWLRRDSDRELGGPSDDAGSIHRSTDLKGGFVRAVADAAYRDGERVNAAATSISVIV